MKIHLFKKDVFVNFVSVNPSGKVSFNNCFNKLISADWETPEDIKKTFGSADFLGNSCNRVVINVGGNNYRVILKYYFGENTVDIFIKWVGTHNDYTKLCNRNGQYSESNFKDYG